MDDNAKPARPDLHPSHQPGTCGGCARLKAEVEVADKANDIFKEEVRRLELQNAELRKALGEALEEWEEQSGCNLMNRPDEEGEKFRALSKILNSNGVRPVPACTTCDAMGEPCGMHRRSEANDSAVCPTCKGKFPEICSACMGTGKA